MSSDAVFMTHLGSRTTANGRYMRNNDKTTLSLTIHGDASGEVHLFLPEDPIAAEEFLIGLIDAAEDLRGLLPTPAQEV